MAYYNSSAARELVVADDFQFSPRITQETTVKPKTRLKVARAADKRHDALAFVNFKTVIGFIAVVACIFVMLNNQAKLNEVSRKINGVKREITQLESEYVRMQSNLESNLSLRTVARRAEQELGLQPIDQHQQIEYVTIYEEGRVEIIEGAAPEGISEQVETFAAQVLAGIKGLFGGE